MLFSVGGGTKADDKVVADSSSESSSDSSSSDSSSDADPQWEAKRILTELAPKTVFQGLCVHLTSRKVHKMRPSGEFTMCGRRVSGMFAEVAKLGIHDSACLVCHADDRLRADA